MLLLVQVWVEYLINRERQMVITKSFLNERDERLPLDAFCERQAVCIDFPFALKLDSSFSVAWRGRLACRHYVGLVPRLPDS